MRHEMPLLRESSKFKPAITDWHKYFKPKTKGSCWNYATSATVGCQNSEISMLQWHNSPASRMRAATSSAIIVIRGTIRRVSRPQHSTNKVSE